jgi:antitoxin component HigA of HigAB toxin-antitoxin module
MTKGKVLSGKRNGTVKMLIALHQHLNIPTDTLPGVDMAAQ